MKLSYCKTRSKDLSLGPINDLRIPLIPGRQPTNDQPPRLLVEAIIRDLAAADGVELLGAHAAELAFGRIDKVWAARDRVLAELGRALVGVAGHDEAAVVRVNDAVSAPELRRSGPLGGVEASSGFRLGVGHGEGEDRSGFFFRVGLEGWAVSAVAREEGGC